MTRHPICISVVLFILAAFPAAGPAAAYDDPFRFHEEKSARTDRGYQGGNAAPLEMILIAGNTRIAMFGGEIYRVGDVIDGYTITAITIDTVTAGDKEGLSRIFNIRRNDR